MEKKVSIKNIHIEDSYNYPKSEMIPELEAIKVYHPECEVFKRSMFSLKCEWITHNALYALGLWKDRTKDVDLDYPCDKPEWVYMVLGILVWPFIK